MANNSTPGELPAFPISPDLETTDARTGMTMREWYAGMALQGLLAWPRTGWSSTFGFIPASAGPEYCGVGRFMTGGSEVQPDQAATIAFQYADAMLAEAAKPR